MKDKVTVDVWAHYKQGDDFHSFLEEYSPVKALEMWGRSLHEVADQLIRASEILAGQDIKADAGTHHVSLSNVPKYLADELVKMPAFLEYDSDEFELGLCD